ncbi:MAG: hypothetical protein OEO23_01455 [Gemmatimonadota bacterium]|nr:hypothetical protein [Gemmatimonadota bacterium]
MRCHRRPRGTWLWAAGTLAAALVACGDPEPARSLEESGRIGADAEPPAPSATGRTYQRTIVFFDTSQDTTMFVPWDFENRSQPGGVAHSLRGWLGRGGEWALFAEDEWITAPSRVPWRILPRGPVRLVVDTDDVMRTVVYREGLRDLTVDIGPTRVEWRGQRGEIYRLSEGTARLSGEASPGMVLDVSTARLTGEPEPAEWAVLTDDEGFTLLVVDPEGPGEYRAWALDGEEEWAWPEVSWQWGETRSFERARRPIPVLWHFASPDGELDGSVEAVSSHLKTLDGEGAILPALGAYEVAGTVTVGEVEREVRGFLRHIQR